MVGNKILFCSECGASVVDVWERSRIKPNEEYLIRQCVNLEYVYSKHYYEVTGKYRKALLKFDPYTGKKNGS